MEIRKKKSSFSSQKQFIWRDNNNAKEYISRMGYNWMLIVVSQAIAPVFPLAGWPILPQRSSGFTGIIRSFLCMRRTVVRIHSKRKWEKARINQLAVAETLGNTSVSGWNANAVLALDQWSCRDGQLALSLSREPIFSNRFAKNSYKRCTCTLKRDAKCCCAAPSQSASMETAIRKAAACYQIRRHSAN